VPVAGAEQNSKGDYQAHGGFFPVFCQVSQIQQELIYSLNPRAWKYEAKFKEWGFRKYLKKSDWRDIDHHLMTKRKLGEDVDVFINHDVDISIPPKRLRRGILRSQDRSATLPSESTELGTFQLD
jgi:hypothetical protein